MAISWSDPTWNPGNPSQFSAKRYDAGPHPRRLWAPTQKIQAEFVFIDSGELPLLLQSVNLGVVSIGDSGKFCQLQMAHWIFNPEFEGKISPRDIANNGMWDMGLQVVKPSEMIGPLHATFSLPLIDGVPPITPLRRKETHCFIFNFVDAFGTKLSTTYTMPTDTLIFGRRIGQPGTANLIDDFRWRPYWGSLF